MVDWGWGRELYDLLYHIEYIPTQSHVVRLKVVAVGQLAIEELFVWIHPTLAEADARASHLLESLEPSRA